MNVNCDTTKFKEAIRLAELSSLAKMGLPLTRDQKADYREAKRPKRNRPWTRQWKKRR